MQNEILQRIDEAYVAADCVQLMFTYDKAMAIICGVDEEAKLIFYHNKTQSSSNFRYTNEYVNDERRKQFPYSNIPIHTKRLLFKKYNVVNQLLNYDTIYQIIRETNDGVFSMYCKVIKDGNSAIVIQGLELNAIFYMTADELKHLNFTKTSEPKIRANLNKGFSSAEIEQQKKLVRSKK